MTPLDLAGPLPRGTTLVEASAGTGKTAALAALTTRYVAEGVADLSQLMLVTFGNAASRELRDRVRERLVRTERGLLDPAAARAGDDPVLRLLAGGDTGDTGDALAERHRARLADALAGFDAATIATTHSFCASMLAGLGLAADVDPSAALAPVDDLLGEVVDDLYLQAYAAPGAPEPDLGRDDLLALGRAAVGDRSARLEPAGAPGVPGRRRRAALRVRDEVEQRKRRAGLVDHDDALLQLRDALAHPAHGAHACARLRARFRVVLVDEFQDTDPVQWEVLRRAFDAPAAADAPVALVLIGDPKQAIYAFRGGDVHTYLAAGATAHARATLTRNWRSDGPLLDALERVLGGVALGHPDIVVRPVEAVHAAPRLSAAGPALRLRQVPRTGHGPLRSGSPPLAAVREAVARDVAADVVDLLQGGARLHTGPGERPVEPGDVAVLVRTHLQGGLVREALARAGVPAVLAGGGSVFRTAGATAWLVLLEALEQPHRVGRVRALALSVFGGHDPAGLDAAGDEITDRLGPRLRQGADLLTERGVAALFEALSAQEQLPARVLARPDGERLLTDLRHVGQVLHAAALHEQLGLTALVEWLRRRIAQAAVEGDDERTRRLETDAAAVQVMTVHTSKGLEFAVVHVPYAWDRWVPDEPDVLRLHGPAGERVLDVGGRGSPGRREALERYRAEEAGEDLRLLYVALTRARCQVVAHWAPLARTAGSPLHRVLFRPDAPPGEAPPATVPVPRDDAEVGRRLAQLADASGGCIGAELVQPRPETRWQPPRQDPPGLAVSRLTRTFDTAWRRTSYSALTAAAHEAPGAGSEPDAPAKDDERDETGGPAPAAAPDGPAGAPGGAPGAVGTLPQEPPPDAVPSPLAGLPAGTAFGTLVHEVLEDPDPARLDERCRDALARRPGSGIDPGALAAGLRPVLHTPLGSLGVALADVGPGDRLAELAFELPLAGGDTAAPAGRPGGGPAAVSLAGVAALLARHDLGPLAGYPALLAQLEPAALRGFLTGSIDAVLRLHGPGPEPRYVVVDHKTNRLGADPLTAWHYRQEALAQEMLRAHYVLQALLYAVALHRFLRWRQRGYDPAVHLGPVVYTFVRGMCGPDGPPGAGVFVWQPPPGLVADLSDLLAGLRPGAGGPS